YNEKTYELTEENHDPTSYEQAMAKAREWPYETEEKIPIGTFYQVEKPTYEERLLKGRIPANMTPGDIKTVLEHHL
ncbi:MAG: 2-oxoacid:ferredoxin oxidoreductase subunit beta, partial [Deltaproteobacteria bacterium]